MPPLFLILPFFAIGAIRCELLMTSKRLNQEKSQLTCITDEVSRALTATHPTSKRKFDVEMMDPSSILAESIEDGLENSLRHNFGLVLDGRWNAFEEIRTAPRYNVDLQRVNAVNLVLGHTFSLPISVRLRQEGHIFICQQDYNPYNSNCYWIMLGAWNGTQSAIRKCKKYAILDKSRGTEDPNCSLKRANIRENPLSEDRWRHLIVSFNGTDGRIKVQFTDRESVFMEFIDREYDYEMSFKSVWVYSALNKDDRNDGVWKFHKYEMNVYRNNQEVVVYPKSSDISCMSMYVYLCKDCTLNLRLIDVNNDEREKMKVYNSDRAQWKYVEFESRYLYRIGTLWGKVTPDDGFFAVHYIRHSPGCFKNNVKYLRFNVRTQFITKFRCQFLGDGSTGIRISEKPDKTHEKNNCSSNSIGDHCFACEDILLDSCQKHMICKNDCYCGAGSNGDYCVNECRDNQYGINCAETTGNCIKNKYNPIDGVCREGCQPNYIGDHCLEMDLPVLTSKPTVGADCYSSCAVSFDNAAYVGKQKPAYFKVLYREPFDQRWIRTDKLDIGKPSIVLSNLAVSTKYQLQVVLFTADDRYFPNKDLYVDFETHCKDLTLDNMKTTQLTDKFAVFSVNKTVDQCSEGQYVLTVMETATKQEIIKFEMMPTTYVYNLLPYRQYEYKVLKGKKMLFENKFVTKESAPGPVIITNRTSTTNEIWLSWNEPKERNGIIKYYIVTHKFISNIFCNTEDQNDNEMRKNTTERMTRLSGLKPYSQYRLSVQAANSVEGTKIDLLYRTQEATDKIDPDAYSVNIATGVNDMLLKLTPNCDKIYSRLTINVTGVCLEEWCEDFKREAALPASQLPFVNLKPYSNYRIEVTLSLPFNRSISVRKPDINIKTLATEANQVSFIDYYSLDGKSISFRWTTPYPPTGKLDGFRIKNTGYHTTTETFEKCTIWTDMYCATVTVPYLNNYYYFTIEALNEGVYRQGKTTRIETYSTSKEPDKPLNLEATWDDYYNLTIRFQHPNRTNGKLVDFLLIVNKKQLVHQITKENLTYTEILPVSSNNSMTFIDVIARNKFGSSEAAHINVKAPPQTPFFASAMAPMTKEGNESIEVTIPVVEGLMSNSFMLVLFTYKTEQETPSNLSSTCEEFSKNDWFCAEILTKKKLDVTKFVTIGDNSNQTDPRYSTVFQNHKLNSNSKIVVEIIVYNELNGYIRKAKHRVMADTVAVGPDDPGNGSLAFLLLLFVPLIVFGVFWYKKKHPEGVKIRTRGSRLDTLPLTQTVISEKKPVAAPVKPNNNPNVPAKFCKPIQLNNFEEYVKASIFNGELQRQHELFPRGEQKPNDYGKLPQNKSKNRYGNLSPYNHSSVRLKKIVGDQFSDYINANYIKGYNNTRGYIATQGPKPNTLNDFWRMVWEQNVLHIVMLANVMENGKKKVEKYWPSYNEDLNFGSINVRHISTEVFADFETRLFHVTNGDEERKVEQLHFTTWPDHGVPLYPQSLVPFVKKILTFPQDAAPIVVHCSAGVGRTGTVILIDLCLRMAAQMGEVDVLRHQWCLREQRTNMVDNLEQYKLVHLVVFECLFSPDTSLPCDENFEPLMRKCVTNVDSQLSYIERSAWQEEAITGKSTAKYKRQVAKDRFPSINDPESYGSFYIAPTQGADSNYINAVMVDGFKQPKSFIATQQPLPKTVGDFWRMVDEYECSIIISLQEVGLDANCCQFWPSDSEPMSPVSDMEVHFVQSEIVSNYNLMTLNLTVRGVSRRVMLILLYGWNYGDDLPNNLSSLLAVYQQMTQLSWKENKVVVTCRDGITASGFYIALCFTLEKIKLEQLCDVCHAVRIIRRSRRQFVTSKEQFIALHELVLLYLNEFELYSNFASK